MTMNVLVCLDTDGVLESGNPKGPIEIRRLEKLESGGAIIILVSPSPNYPKGRNNLPLFTQIATNTRRENLEDAAKWVQGYGMDPILRLYVSDNGDWREAEDAGFIYIDSKMFAGGRF